MVARAVVSSLGIPVRRTCLVCLLLTLPLAGSADDLQIPWWSIDAGGGELAGGPYVLQGSAGQPDTAVCSGSGIELTGGFWSVEGISVESTLIFSDGFESGNADQWGDSHP